MSKNKSKVGNAKRMRRPVAVNPDARAMGTVMNILKDHPKVAENIYAFSVKAMVENFSAVFTGGGHAGAVFQAAVTPRDFLAVISTRVEKLADTNPDSDLTTAATELAVVLAPQPTPETIKCEVKSGAWSAFVGSFQGTDNKLAAENMAWFVSMLLAGPQFNVTLEDGTVKHGFAVVAINSTMNPGVFVVTGESRESWKEDAEVYFFRPGHVTVQVDVPHEDATETETTNVVDLFPKDQTPALDTDTIN